MAAPASLAGAPADPDPEFHGSGIVLTGMNLRSLAARSLAIQKNGRIVVAGQSSAAGSLDPEAFLIARYLPDGALDPSFGTGGIVTTSFAGTGEARCVRIQPDGRIVAAGTAGPPGNPDFAVARYLENGSPDPAFHGSGSLLTSVSSFADAAFSLAIQPDGKLVVAGTRSDSTGANEDIAVVRYLADGSLDPAFSGGIVVTAPGALRDTAGTVIVQPDGKIVIVGSTQTATGNDFLVIRFTAGGIPDPDFSGDGIAILATPEDDAASGALLQPDGMIVTAGHSFGLTGARFAVARLMPDGSLDSSFGTAGRLTADIGAGNDLGRSVALQNDGKLIVAGYSEAGEGYDFSLLRLTPEGLPDTGFHPGGKLLLHPAPGFNMAEEIAIQRNGRIITAGFSDENFTSRIALCRLLGDPAPILTLHNAAGDLVESGNLISFGSVVTGGATSRLSLRIRNSGGASLGGITLEPGSGAHAADFQVLRTPLTEISPAAETDFELQFSPTASGLRSEAIVIQSNDRNASPFVLRLDGTGTPFSDVWRQTHFGSASNTGAAADLNDAELDGQVNLQEFAFGTDPYLPDPPPLSIARTETGLALHWNRLRASLPEVSVLPEQSTSPSGPWQSAGQPVQSGIEGDRIRMSLPLLFTGSSFFYRLRIITSNSG